MVKVVALLLLGVLLVVAYYVVKRRIRAALPSPGKSLWRRLVKLTHDPAAAKRLLEGARKKHPKLSESALLERVIKKLERDRER